MRPDSQMTDSVIAQEHPRQDDIIAMVCGLSGRAFIGVHGEVVGVAVFSELPTEFSQPPALALSLTFALADNPYRY
jgi:hypothetical protein